MAVLPNCEDDAMVLLGTPRMRISPTRWTWRREVGRVCDDGDLVRNEERCERANEEYER